MQLINNLKSQDEIEDFSSADIKYLKQYFNEDYEAGEVYEYISNEVSAYSEESSAPESTPIIGLF